MNDVRYAFRTLLMSPGFIGSLAAAGLSGSLGIFLYGVSALDPLSFIGAALLLLAVAFLANCVPARRAARVDPLVVLRSS